VTRTLLIRYSDAQPPQELYEILREASTILCMTQSPTPTLATSVDHVVVWNDPQIEVDQRTLCWPADADLVRVLLRSWDADAAREVFP
jgi:hypothetical protein